MSTLTPTIDSIEEAAPSMTFSNAPLIDPPETGSPNGGYLAKLLLEASIANREFVKLAPRVVAVQFISPPAFEPMGILVEVLRKSRSSCFLSVRAYQRGKVKIVGQCSYGQSENGPYHQPDKMPEAPDPQACPEAQLPGVLWPHFSQHCDYRIAHSPAVFSGAERAEMLCWIRMRDMPLDAGGMVFLFDSMFPTFFLAATTPYQSVTTDLNVEFSDSFIEQGNGTWVLFRLRVREWAGGWCVEDAEAWSARGLFLAVGRQMRRVFAGESSDSNPTRRKRWQR